MSCTHSRFFTDPDIVRFLDDFHKLVVKDALQDGTDRNNKVIDFHLPHALEKLLQLSIGSEPESTDAILGHCKQIIQYSVKTGHPYFFNQLYSGLEPFSLAGSWLTDCLNTNIHTYEVAPVFILIEKCVIDKLCGIVGFQNGDGIFCPGGSFSNIMAVNLARYRLNPGTREKGMFESPQMRIYSSCEAHYSSKKAAFFMGFGTNNVIGIPTDEKGCMLADLLEQQMQEDKLKKYIPTIVIATSGTTVLGSYDPLEQIADVCSRHGAWLHVDAGWGGGVLLTDKYRNKVKGIERADSVAWNLHKMSCVPVQCSALLVKEKGVLICANGLGAEYIFQPDKSYDISYDVGDKTVQCGRKVDALKLWIMWKALGDKGMAEHVERAFRNAEYFTQKLRETEGFRLVIPEFQCTNICFWYIPPSLRDLDETEEWWTKVSKVAPEIKKRMLTEGTLMIGYQPLSSKKMVNFFRIVIENPLCDFSDMDFVISEIDRLGRDL